MKKLILILLLSFSFSSYATEKTISTSDGVDLYVKIKGSGTPLLYLHGGPGSGSYWFEEFFGDFMEENFTVIYLDQRGVGRSGSPENDDYSIQRMVKDFEEVRLALGYENWLTLGHSFGGILQMGYAEFFPQAQKGMLMINCTLNIEQSFCESWSPKAAEILGQEKPECAKDSVSVMERMQQHINGLREKDMFWKMAYADKKNDAIMNATYEVIPNWNYDFGNIALYTNDYWKNFKPATSAVKEPVLFFFGKNDWMVGPEHYIGVEFPEMLLWKSEVGHMPFLEAKPELEKAILAYKAKYKV